MSQLSLNDASWLADTLARNRLLFGSTRMEADSGEGDGKQGDGKGGDEGRAFTQADVDAAVEKVAAKIRADERRKVSEKYADYDDLKKKAGEQATAEERIAELQKQVETTQREVLKRRVQAAHGISDEDADLFLTGTDEETLTSQAKRLADREAERKTKGNRVPGEGRTHMKPGDDPMRAFTRNLFGRED